MDIFNKLYAAAKYVAENWEVIGTFLLMLFGSLTIVATILGILANKLKNITQNHDLQGRLGAIANFCNKVALFGQDVLQLFPTFGTNPKTKAMKERLDQLEALNAGQSQKPADPNPGQS